jgi:hypothetical protein
LLTVGYAGVGYSLRMQPEKIIVLRHHDTSGEGGELEVRHVSRAEQARLRGGNHVDVPPPKTSRDVGGNVLVKMKADGHQSGCFFQAFLAQFRLSSRDG